MPLEYTIMQYRLKFNVSWDQVMAMPAEVFWHDLEMLALEQEVVGMKHKAHTRK